MNRGMRDKSRAGEGMAGKRGIHRLVVKLERKGQQGDRATVWK